MTASAPRAHESDANRTGPAGLDSLERLTSALLGATARALAESQQAGDLTLTQWRTLVVVGAGEGMRIGDVAARLGVSMPSASRFVRRLEQRGLTTTTRDPADRRAAIVRPTAHGIAVSEDVLRRRQQLVQEALAAAPPLPAATDLVLEAVAEALRRYA